MHTSWSYPDPEVREIVVARCTVARLVRELGLRGVLRGRRVKTTTPVAVLPYPVDRVNRVFTVRRPNALWLADLTDVETRTGFVYVAFIIDAYARRIVGWRVSSSLRTDLALDALEQALHERVVDPRHTLIHHEDRGSQYLSIRYTERLAQAGIEQSVGSVGDSYDNTLAESIIGLYKEAWSRWNSRRSNGSTGSTIGAFSGRSDTALRHRPKRRTTANASTRHWPRDSSKKLSGKPGAVQLPRHLQRYISEFAGKHNVRESDTRNQMWKLVFRFTDRTFPYRKLVADNGLSFGARS